MKTLFLKVLSIFLLFVLLPIQNIQSQALGTWKSYMAYQNATMVAAADNGCVYAVYKGYPYNNSILSDGSLLKYDPRYDVIKKISKSDGLNDVYIVRIAYMETEKILVIVYDNGNIDLYDTAKDNDNAIQTNVYNISSFMNKSELADKTVNDIVFIGSYAYICMNYGIIAIDVKTKTIKDTYKINKKVSSMCIWGDYIYAATEEGIKRAKKDGYLLSASSWLPYELSYPGGTSSLITKVLTYNDSFVFYQSGVGVFYQTEPYKNPDPLPNNPPKTLNQMDKLNNQLVLLDNSEIYFYPNLVFDKKVNTGYSSTQVASINNSDTYWLAQGYYGISGVSKNTGSSTPQVTADSPKRNLVFNMKYNQGKLLIVGGGMYSDNYNNLGTLMIMENDQWSNLNESEVQTAIRLQTEVTINCRDLSDVVVDPEDKDHYFVTSYGEGLYEFRSNPETKKIDFVYLYTERNTNKILKSVLNDNPNAFIRLGGLTYDNGNNLYVVSSYVLDVECPIIIHTKNGVWKNIYDPDLPRIALFKNLMCTTKGQKWVVASRTGNYAGLYVFKDSESGQNNISYFSKSFVDQDGEKLDITAFSCLAEDANGTIWVGTTLGPIVFYNPENITQPGSSGFGRCSRIKVPLYDGNNGAHYLLDKVSVTSIAVDGANRKWIGTNGSGVYLVSPTGEEVIAYFNTDNSPLISDVITRIAINNDNGEVFIGTNKGLVSYISDATEGKIDYSNVYAYPNPVKPDFTGDVVVTGLIKDSNVKITDLSGNTMYQGTSVGGQFTWNCKNRYGERVKTGVYLVMAATSDGTQGVVSKIVVIK